MKQNSNNSPTRAGSNPEAGNQVVGEAGTAQGANASASSEGMDHADAIVSVFATFEFAYHNQFHKAYPSSESLIIAKKVWLENLSGYTPLVIVAAAKKVVKTSEYLPTIASMVQACEQGADLFGLPDARSAYVEACSAPPPKVDHQWSHPAVYHAGKACSWYLLANEPESTALPIFEHHYKRLCSRVMQGQELAVEAPIPLPEKTTVRLEGTELKQRIRKLRKELDL